VLERFLEPAAPRDRLPARGASRHCYALHVRWSDVDAYRHVNNVKYFEFFQEARIQYLLDLRNDGEWGHQVVARTDVDYRRPLLFRSSPYQLHSWVSHVGTRSFAIAGEIRDGGTVLATGEVVMVCFDKQTQRATDMPAAQRAALLAELEALGRPAQP
jgi:acyl-CoA thioester hydrolase